jgi:hypothetical protein
LFAEEIFKSIESLKTAIVDVWPVDLRRYNGVSSRALVVFIPFGSCFPMSISRFLSSINI